MLHCVSSLNQLDNTLTKLAYILFTADGVDQICETPEDARREQLEVNEMLPCAYVIVPWAEQNAASDRIDNLVKIGSQIRSIKTKVQSLYPL